MIRPITVRLLRKLTGQCSIDINLKLTYNTLMGFKRRQIDRHKEFLLNGLYRPKAERIKVRYNRKQKHKERYDNEYR